MATAAEEMHSSIKKNESSRLIGMQSSPSCWKFTNKMNSGGMLDSVCINSYPADSPIMCAAQSSRGVAALGFGINLVRFENAVTSARGECMMSASRRSRC